MKNIKLIFAYDGSSYLGWQQVKEGATIEGELSKVLTQIFQHPIKLQVASRTDAGVHAQGQVANFFTAKQLIDTNQLHYSLNQMLPPSIRIWEIGETAPTFHPTLEAKEKEYFYTLTTTPIQLPFDRHFAWHVRDCMDRVNMSIAANDLIGYHDFSSFCNISESESESPYCTLSRLEVIEESPETLRIALRGDRFLYKMARNLVGTLVDVGRGKMTLQEVQHLIEKKDRTQAGVTAPAHGLCLKGVYYL
ncbi:MAG: tRNA pseudouridine(38-40) synthase TruA [Chlamydiota bacterium]